MRMKVLVFAIALLAEGILAQSQAYGQCKLMKQEANEMFVNHQLRRRRHWVSKYSLSTVTLVLGVGGQRLSPIPCVLLFRLWRQLSSSRPPEPSLVHSADSLERWTGSTSCVSGYTCTYSNAYYSQCLPGSGGGSGGGVTSTAGGSSPTSSASVGGTTPAANNPFSGVGLYANPYYASEISTSAIPSLTGAMATKAAAVAKVPTFVWL